MSDQYVAFKTRNGSYLCAEGGGGHELVANRAAVGKWEVFRVSRLPGDRVALQAFSGHYVCAENGGGREVVANRTSIGPWETFTWVAHAHGGSDYVRIYLQASNGQYVCAESGGGGEVNANRDVAAEWETFTVVTPPSGIPFHEGWGASNT